MNPLFVAIDTPEGDRAAALANRLKGHVGGIKLGLEYFCANGPEAVRSVAEAGIPVFLDLKLHDIPNTVAGAMRSLAPIRPAIVTVHAGGGKAMLEAARQAAPQGTRVVAVTILTSMDEGDLRSVGMMGSPADQVRRLASLARSAGLDGIVCSGAEVGAVHADWPEGFFVVPGIRPAGSDVGDQKRVVTPAAALADGASVLVVGRPITQADDPVAAADALTESLG